VADASDRRRSLDLRHDKMALLGELTVGIAHELNNSIGFIGSNLGSLRRYSQALVRLVERVEPHLAPEHRPRWQAELAAAQWQFIAADLDNLLSETQAGADHLKHVVADLKILARSSPSTEGTSVDACVASALTVLAHQVKHRCVVERHLAAPRALVMVRSQVIQLVINLVLNAVQALPSNGGTIRVVTSDDGRTVTLQVSDSGSGISESVRAHLFDPYVTTKATGTGVGLALCQQIAAFHGGSIAAGPCPQLGGACFTVLLIGANDRRSETQGA
jgi:two-component system NtrC family sensor kinase